MSDRFPPFVRIVEVGPRDGLQNEAKQVSTENKLELIDRLGAAGLRSIEATAFVSPRWVPQMADHADLLRRIVRRPGVGYPVLVPNMQGLEAALASGAQAVAVFGAASEAFSQKNINCSIAQSLDRFRPVVEAATRHSVPVRGYISCALGCPYQGSVAPDAVADIAEALAAMGCYEVVVSDTTGVGTPGDVRRVLERVGRSVPLDGVACHFHDTYGQALANIYAALEFAVAVFDASVAGLGGCPYSPGASGNVATEDVVYMLHGLGIDTGVDLDRLCDAGSFISAVLDRPTQSKVAAAMRTKSDPTHPVAYRPSVQ